MSVFSDSYLAANANCFPPERLPQLRQRLDQLDESQVPVIMAVELKNPTIALLLSILGGGFGLDRFYLGHIGLGIAKLLFSWLTFGIWVVVDWFMIMGAAKRVNAEKLDTILMTTEYRSGW